MVDANAATLGVGDRPSELVLAAGGLILRPVGLDRLEMVIVHRPIRDDWSYPKGKLEPKETLTECALREVFEETGLRCRILSFVGTTEYRDRKDRPKIVAYWAMALEGGSFETTQEVDEMRWVQPEEAAAILTYERDRELLVTLQEPLHWLCHRLARSA